MHSNQTAILTTFKITAIKFKANEKIVGQTNWKLIGYHNTTNDISNNVLYMYNVGSITYSNYNKHTLQDSTNTAAINNQKNKGRFNFSCNSLLPLIEARGELLSYC